MNIFKKIKDVIDRRKSIDNIHDDIQNLDEVLVEKRIEIFKEIVTPKFAEIGLNNWNGKYLWYSNFNEEGIKHVIEYNVFKYYGGSFTFGNCYNFIPRIISFEYILVFLFKQKKDNKIAKYWLGKHFEKCLNNEIEMELIKERII